MAICMKHFWNQSRNKLLRLFLSRSASSNFNVGFNNYEKEYKNFKLDVPEYFNFSKHVLEEWKIKELNGERLSSFPAFWWADDYGREIKWNFETLILESNKVSNILSEVFDIQFRDCVMVVLPQLPEWWLINIACLQTGAIISPGTSSLRVKDFQNRLLASKAKCVITIPELTEAVDKASEGITSLKKKVFVDFHSNFERNGWFSLNRLMNQASNKFQCFKTRASDPLAWFFTSGTTGLPKIAEHTHASYGLAHKITGRFWLDLTPNDVMWNVSDTGWAKSAYSSFFGPWWQGSCVFVYNTPRFNAKKTLEILQKYPISVTCLPPTAYRLLVLEDIKKFSFNSLRHCVSAGEPLNPQVIEVWKRETGLYIREGYGQTEMTLSCGMFQCINMKPGSMGKPTPGYDLQIIDDDGNILEPFDEGEIALKCFPVYPVGLFNRYVGDPVKTKESFKGNFYLTGDRGYKDRDGYFWFVGRSDDVINSAGYRIGPFEVESALIEHPAVVESAVIGVPCDIRGSIVKAFVVLADDYKAHNMNLMVKMLQDHVKMCTAPYKYPRKYILSWYDWQPLLFSD
ncbi:acyl-coenzyme A synthetase ACSM3, mitochondrial isoform X2 [Hydra vulgaris]|uniref:acyl-coenzyme A synthetase ACSM3, mitochondrial isoform X2 n=1 Tax=Hydra vulgaris TaxID=6087 RepID=UPI001F5FE7A8|nr:acyl-coenzyme A synthetase ACSM3, mitochondrial isoform X2 [Hydra vulgaris]